MNQPNKVPVLINVFAREEMTAKILDRLSEWKPERLYVAADGPRVGRVDEVEKCKAVRSLFDSHVNWPCQVFRRFRSKNMGCNEAIPDALDWFFGEVESGIVLEDDTLPECDFQRFASELLERFRDDERVMMISARNEQFVTSNSPSSYSFSAYGGIWGWASWRRAWKKRHELPDRIDEFLAKKLMANSVSSRGCKRRIELFNYHNQSSHSGWAWDLDWYFVRALNSGLSCVPNINLSRNIGFGSGATHTHDVNDPRATLDTGTLLFPLRHPNAVVQDRDYDEQFVQNVDGVKDIPSRPEKWGKSIVGFRDVLERRKRRVKRSLKNRIEGKPLFIICPPRSGSGFLFEQLTSTGLFDHLPHEADKEWSGALSVFRIKVGCDSLMELKIGQAFRAELLDRLNEKIIPARRSQGTVPYLDKTIANTLRLPVLAKLFPEARYIFIRRDPREVISSMLEGWPFFERFGKPELTAKLRCNRKREIDHWSYPSPEGWEEWVDQPLPEICAWSWMRHVEEMLLFREKTSSPILDVTYSDLVKNPPETVQRILEFADMSELDRAPSSEWNNVLSQTTVSKPEAKKWRRLHEKEINGILAMISDTAERFGFVLSSVDT